MCTAVSKGGLFGRTLDVEKTLGESRIICPRKYEFAFIYEDNTSEHPAIVGTALDVGTPLWFDAMNEYGLGVAGLNFPGLAVYHDKKDGMHNIASFEFIPWILSKCKTAKEAKELLLNTNITPDAFAPSIPPSRMHWIVADASDCIVAEPTAEGLMVYDNEFGVMANPPEFPVHAAAAKELKDIPGDTTSRSRFLRALYAKEKTVRNTVSDYFRIMDTVSVPYGLGKMYDGADALTVYTSCMDLANGDYYYSTYEDRAINKVSFSEIDLNSSKFVTKSRN